MPRIKVLTQVNFLLGLKTNAQVAKKMLYVLQKNFASKFIFCLSHIREIFSKIF